VAITAIVHIIGEDAFAADLDQMPDPTHAFVAMRNLRRKDGKPVNYLTDGAQSVLYSWNRITFIEIMSTGASNTIDDRMPAAATTVLGFFREDG
jgi:hypothetical protein